MTPQRHGSITVVTDSTAYLPTELVERYDIHVVPIHVVIGGTARREGEEVTPADVARALRDRRADVTTSRPNPSEFTEMYEALLSGGASGVVSVHMSRKLSGTFEAAEAAAKEFGDRVTVLDSGSTGMGLGFPVLAAAEAAAAGKPADEVAGAAVDATGRTSIFFYVDSLEFLRRGGRIGAAEALLGTALAVKPILHVSDGKVVVKEKVRTAGRALARLRDLAVEAAGEGTVDVAVHHLDAPQRAADLADQLRANVSTLDQLHSSEVGAAVGAHVGPGVVAAVVFRR